MFFWARGRPDEAVALMERALRVDPGNVESRIMMADFLVQAGRLDEGLSHYKDIADAEPSEPRPLLGMAEVLKRRGAMSGAIDVLRKTYELSRDVVGMRTLCA